MKRYCQLAHNVDSVATTLVVLPRENVDGSADELATLAVEFQKSYEELLQSNNRLQAEFKKSTAEAIACGRILIRVKKLLGHGGWIKWVNEHTKISISTAERYKHLAENSSQMTNMTSKTLTTCYHEMGLLKEPKSKNNGGQSQRPEPSEFVQAKGLAVRLWNLLVRTNDADRMAKEIEGIIQWHQQYLDEKKKMQDAKARDQEFEVAIQS